jgi:hypothetical protein
MKELDYCPDICHGISPLFRKFWDMLWPVFIAELKTEILEPVN